MWTLGSPTIGSRSLAPSPVASPLRAPVVGQADLVDDPAADPQRPHPVGDQHPGLDRRPGGDDRRPAAVDQPPQAGQLRADLAEHLGLELGQVAEGAAHPSGGVVLGEPVGGEHERVGGRAGRVEAVARPVVGLHQRVGLAAVQVVGDRRLGRLVVGGQRPVVQAVGHEQPALAVGLHHERAPAVQGLLGPRVVGRVVAGGGGRPDVGVVVPGPAPRLGVPPDIALALRPGPALGVGRGPVVEDAPVVGPGPAPLGRDPALLGPGLAPVGLVDLVGVDPRVDPAAAGGRAVGLQLQVRRGGPGRRGRPRRSRAAPRPRSAPGGDLRSGTPRPGRAPGRPWGPARRPASRGSCGPGGSRTTAPSGSPPPARPPCGATGAAAGCW